METIGTLLHIQSLTILRARKMDYVTQLNKDVMNLLVEMENNPETKGLRPSDHAAFNALNSELIRARKHVANLNASLGIYTS